jgi:hypothetical protein
MKCAICGITIDSMDEAMDEGWEPYFYDGEIEHEFACPACAETFLQQGEDGEMEVKEEYRAKMKYHDRQKEQGQNLIVGVILSKKDDDPKP